MTTAIQLAEERIIESFESGLRTGIGPAMAFFELPQKNAAPVRVIYVVYAVSGRDLGLTVAWFYDRVVNPLIEKAGDGGLLYWRNPEQLTVKLRNVQGFDQFVIRTRIAVLTAGLEEVRIEDAIKPEGLAPQEAT